MPVELGTKTIYQSRKDGGGLYPGIRLVEEMSQKDRRLANEQITGKSTYSDIITALPALYDKAITNTRLSFDKNVMIRIHNYLQKSECIDIYGTGISYHLAKGAAFKRL